MDQLLDMRLRNGVSFDHLASVYEEYTGKIAVENLRPSWLIFSDGFRKTRVSDRRQAGVRPRRCRWSAWCVSADDGGSSQRSSKLTSRGPVLYHQERVGLNGRMFTVHKFRTMRQDAEAATRAGVERDARRRASRRSAASCGARGSTSSRSCGTCCAAT